MRNGGKGDGKSVALSTGLLSVEIYSRNGSNDSRSEKGGVSFPEIIGKEDCRYDQMKSYIIHEVDIKNTVSKRTLGFMNYNILITASLLVYPIKHSRVAFGPAVHQFLQNDSIKLTDACLLLRKSTVEI
jgi:hypothetical protein